MSAPHNGPTAPRYSLEQRQWVLEARRQGATYDEICKAFEEKYKERLTKGSLSSLLNRMSGGLNGSLTRQQTVGKVTARKVAPAPTPKPAREAPEQPHVVKKGRVSLPRLKCLEDDAP